MNYIYSYWKNNENEKIMKSKRDEKNIMLETKINRNIEYNRIKNNNRSFEKYSGNNRFNLKIDHINFREEIFTYYPLLVPVVFLLMIKSVSGSIPFNTSYIKVITTGMVGVTEGKKAISNA